MEAVGIAASFIAIGQAVVAGRNAVNLLQSLPKVGTELTLLNNEVESLRATIEAAEMQGMTSFKDEPEPPHLKLARRRLEKTVKGLEDICGRCTRAVDKDGNVKARRAKWFLLQKDLAECRSKARDAGANLQLALTALHLKQTSQITLRIEKLTIESAADNSSKPRRMSDSKHGTTDAPLATLSDVRDRSSQNLTQQMAELMISGSGNEATGSQPLLGTDVLVFKAKLATAETCPSPCWCRCHASRPSTFEPPMWARKIVGSLFVTYNRHVLLGSQAECSNEGCKGNRKPTTTLIYKFPVWLCSRYISFQASMSSFSGLSASLRPVRVLSDSAAIWHIVQKRSRIEVQQYMLHNGTVFPEDYHNSGGYSLLECAIAAATPDVLAFLVQFWTNDLGKDTHDHWAIAVQAQRELAYRPNLSPGDSQIYRKIISFGEDTTNSVQTPLHQAACLANDNPDAQQAVQRAFDRYSWAISESNHEGRTPLDVAAHCGNLKAVTELIRLGCNINQITFSGRTALMGAVQMGHLNVARHLIEAGCAVNSTGSNGRTALHLAACPIREPDNDPVGMIRLLLAAGASARARDMLGNTALHLLNDSEYGEAATQTKVRLLADAGAGVNARNIDGSPALFRAVRRNQPDVVRHLIEKGAHTNNYRQLGSSLLHDAALYAGLKVLECLESMTNLRMNTDALDAEGDTAWDCFIYVTELPEWELGSLRRPGKDERKAFVSLYKRARDRNIEIDINRLQWTRRYLVDKDQRGASAALESLIKEKKVWKSWDLLCTYKTVLVQVRESMWEAAMESVDENIEVLREKMAQLPLGQVSHYDYLKEQIV